MKTIDWLLENESYVQYATRLNLLKQSKEELTDLKNAVLSDERIIKYLKDIVEFNSILVTTHKNPVIPINKLIFLLDVGLDIEVPEIKQAIKQILCNKGCNGMYHSMTNVPKHFGGTGEDTLAWALCDAPNMLFALSRAGLDYDKHIKNGIDFILSLSRDNGFPCAVSKELGKFRGPGRKDDCCPYATLITLRLLSTVPKYLDSETVNRNIEILLDLWENSKMQHPYMFYMGTDFRKLKAPTVWYDILSVTECLSHFEAAKKHKRFQEMLDIIEKKADENFRFTPESIYLKCKEWDFGQKKKPSPWLTYLCLRVLNRCGRIDISQ